MSILTANQIKLNATVADKFEAIRLSGQLLVDGGHVPASYIDYMIEREQLVSTYMGSGLAIPHGTNEAKSIVKSTGISVVTIPEGVDFGDGERAYLIIGIAAIGDGHLELLTNVAMVLSDESLWEQIIFATAAEQIISIFEQGLV